MTSITLSVPEEVRNLMKKFPEVNWSALVRQCIIQKTKALQVKNELMNQLNKEKEFNNWAVDLIRKGRKNEGCC
jgi:hypothetical protein